MCFELVELCLENSLLLLKAHLGNDGMNVAESAGGLIFFSFLRHLCRETTSHPLKYLHLCCLHLEIHVCAR